MKSIDHKSINSLSGIDYKILYKIGAIAAFIAALLFRRNLDVEWMSLRGMGIFNLGPSTPPSTMDEWFELLQQNAILGLTLLNLFDLVNYILVGFIFLGLFTALRHINRSWLILSAAFGFTGVIIYLTSNQAITLLSLSHQYASAITNEQRGMLLDVGRKVLAIHQNAGYTGAGIYPSYLFVTIAGLIISIVMLYSDRFNHRTAKIGIIANGVGLGYYITLLFAPALVYIPLSISAIFLVVWYLLVGIRLWSISSDRMPISERATVSNQHSIPIWNRVS